MKTLNVKITKTAKQEPLAVVDGLPGGWAELRPEQLRVLARVLNQIADDTEEAQVKETKQREYNY